MRGENLGGKDRLGGYYNAIGASNRGLSHYWGSKGQELGRGNGFERYLRIK